MTKPFASLELARLYETQGHPEDALAMYLALDHDLFKGGAAVSAAIKRLELALLKKEAESVPAPEASGDLIAGALADLNPEVREADPAWTGEAHWTGEEKRIARLMEKWLALLVVRKRLELFSRIRSRL